MIKLHIAGRFAAVKHYLLFCASISSEEQLEAETILFEMTKCVQC
jgi:hypothetical protein